MTATLELSERLEECAKWNEMIAKNGYEIGSIGASQVHEQWAADIRSLILPKPQGAPDSSSPTR